MRRKSVFETGVALLLLATPAAAQAPADPAAYTALHARVSRAFDTHDAAAGLPLARQAVVLAARLFGPADRRSVEAVEELALMERLAGNLHAAAAHWRQVIATREATPALAEGVDGARTSLVDVLDQLGDTDGALQLLVRNEQAEAARAGPDSRFALIRRRTRGQFLRDHGRYDAARDVLLPVLLAYQKVEGADGGSAIGTVLDMVDLELLAGRQGDALDYLTSLQEMRFRNEGGADAVTLDALRDPAGALTRAGRLDEAAAFMRLVVAQSIEKHSIAQPVTLLYLRRLVEIERQRGNLGEAEALAANALEAARIVLRDKPDQREPYLALLAAIYIDQRRDAEAAPLLEAAAALVPEHGVAGDGILLQRAASLVQQRRYAEAESILRRFAPPAAGELTNAIQISGAADLATLLFEEDKLAEAAALAERADRGARRFLPPDDPLTGQVGYLLSRIRYAQGRYAAAIAALPPLDEAKLADPNRPVDAETASNAAALAAARLALPTTAAAALTPARAAYFYWLGRTVNRTGDTYAAAQIARDQQSLGASARLYADALWQGAARARDGTRDDAFQALQSLSYGAADAAIAQVAAQRLARARSPVAVALVAERRAAQEEWTAANAAYAALAAAPGVDADHRRDALYHQLLTAAERRRTAEARLQAELPQALDAVSPLPVTLAGAGAALQPDEALLLLAPGLRGTHVVAITRTEARWVRSPVAQPAIDSDVQRLLWDVGAPIEPPPQLRAELERRSPAEFDRAAAYRLYGALIAPVAPLLAGKRRLFVVASGPLTSLPLALLVTAPPIGADDSPAALRGTHWFADEHALAVLPSVKALVYLRTAVPANPAIAAARGGFVGFGDPALDGAAETRGAGRARGAIVTLRGGAQPLADPAQLRRLERLPGTAVELHAMQAALTAPAGALFLGARATETAFKATPLTGLSVLALATHGAIAGDVDGVAQPGLVFTPPTAATPADDGFLTATEIADLHIDADWVILSACNTAAGDGAAGAPGLSGLARSFFVAGARTLLVSHWPVLDAVAPRLTVGTVEALRDHPELDRAEALQRTMRAIRNDHVADATFSWAHPRAWAVFSLVGVGSR